MLGSSSPASARRWRSGAGIRRQAGPHRVTHRGGGIKAQFIALHQDSSLIPLAQLAIAEQCPRFGACIPVWCWQAGGISSRESRPSGACATRTCPTRFAVTSGAGRDQCGGCPDQGGRGVGVGYHPTPVAHQPGVGEVPGRPEHHFFRYPPAATVSWGMVPSGHSLSWPGKNICSIGISNTSAILKASGKLGSYLPFSIALTVCRVTSTGRPGPPGSVPLGPQHFQTVLHSLVRPSQSPITDRM